MVKTFVFPVHNFLCYAKPLQLSFCILYFFFFGFGENKDGLLQPRCLFHFRLEIYVRALFFWSNCIMHPYQNRLNPYAWSEIEIILKGEQDNGKAK